MGDHGHSGNEWENLIDFSENTAHFHYLSTLIQKRLVTNVFQAMNYFIEQFSIAFVQLVNYCQILKKENVYCSVVFVFIGGS